MELVQQFNAGDPDVFLISLKAGGTGLNLTGADMVIHYDPWWNGAVEDQATDRAHRIGQKKIVYVMKMIASGTIEEKVLALQRRKQAVIAATVSTTDDAVMQKLTAEDIGKYRDLKISVLVNEYSASAAELFTSNIRDYELGKIVGTKTYGKGCGQTTYSLAKYGLDGGLKLTWGKTTGAQGYRVYKSTSKGWAKVTDITDGNVTTYTDKTVAHNTTAKYTVRAFINWNGNVVWDSAKGKELSARYIMAPATVKVSGIVNGIKVAWTGVSGATSYKIYKRIINSDGNDVSI